MTVVCVCLQSVNLRMPCIYKKKGAKNQWRDEKLQEAMQKVKSHELSLRAAAIRYDIPKSTFLDHLKGVSTKLYGGCSTVLTRDEECEIVLTCHILVEMGIPLTKGYVEVVVTDYLKNQNRTSSFGPSGVPGRSWWEKFTSMAYTGSMKAATHSQTTCSMLNARACGCVLRSGEEPVQQDRTF